MRMAVRVLQSSAVLMLVIAWLRPANAAWPTDSLVDVPLCTADSLQQYPMIVADGAGGAIAAWRHRRSGGWDKAGISTRHLLSSGDPDPAWPQDGRAVCAGGCGWGSEWKLLADGAGGVIVSWTGAHNRGIYAQHVLANGEIDPAWLADGVAACTTPSNEYLDTATDGAGGAILTWVDLRGDKTLWDIYAQHVLKSGVVDPAWPVDGLALCIAPGRQYRPSIVADGAGGAIVSWQDQRRDRKLLSWKWFYDVSGNIYAQHVLASGRVDPEWPANGRCLSEAGMRQNSPQSIADGAGGAIVTWQDNRKGDNRDDIYAQRVLANGKVAPAWPNGGIRLCDAEGSQRDAAIVTDGAGGAIVCWQDDRAGSRGIYAQHALASGRADPAWPDNGRALCLPKNDVWPCIVADGAGGAIVAWIMSPAYSSAETAGSTRVGQICAQHVLGNGALSPDWPADGRILCSAVVDPYPRAISDAAGGAIVVFTSCKSGSGDPGDGHASGPSHIFVKRVGATGQLGGTRKEAH